VERPERAIARTNDVDARTRTGARWAGTGKGACGTCAGERLNERIYAVTPDRGGLGMQTRAVIERRWLARFRSRPVSLSSPYPVEECLRRLSTVSAQRGATPWYLSSRTVGCPEPRLRGDVEPSRIFVAEWKAASGRNSFVPWLDARLEPDGEGRTTFRGQIGLRPEVVTVLALIAGVGGLICMAMVVSGIAVLAHGHLSGLPLALWPFAMAAFIAGINFAGLRSLERDIPKLIREVNAVLDSTNADFASPTA